MGSRDVPRRAVLASAALGLAVGGVLPAHAEQAPVFRSLRYETQGPICTITLDRPGADKPAHPQPPAPHASRARPSSPGTSPPATVPAPRPSR
eukprot:gene60128-82271_t